MKIIVDSRCEIIIIRPVNEKKRTDQLDRLIAKLAALTQEWRRENRSRQERELIKLNPATPTPEP